jgi:hypothetical protein
MPRRTNIERHLAEKRRLRRKAWRRETGRGRYLKGDRPNELEQ